MTIAAGFICSDGILLASDTLYSNTGMGLRYGQKFWVLEHGNVLVAFGGAGTQAGMTRTRDEIDRKLKPGLSRIRVIDTIDDALKKVHEKLPNPDWNTQGLIVIRIDGESILYENSTGINMLNRVQHRCQCVGYGQGLGWYFAETLFREGIPMKWAKVVAAHLIKNVKTYSESCGGDTQILAIGERDVEVVTKQQVDELEAYLAPLENAYRAVLPGNDPNGSEQTLGRRMDILTREIEKVRGLAVATFDMGTTPLTLRHPPTLNIAPSDPLQEGPPTPPGSKHE